MLRRTLQNRKLYTCSRRYFATENAQLKQTKLYDFHVENQGKMVPFAGFSMPVQYGKFGVGDSVKHTRQNASIFDVSHMGQLQFYGNDVVPFLENILVSSIKPLKPNQGKYTLMTNTNGGIIDDLIVANTLDMHGYHYMVINAGRIKEDLEHIDNQISLFNGDVRYEFMSDYSLVAYQGPKAVDILSNLSSNYDFNNLKFFYLDNIRLGNIDCQVSRSGYTGEDGFEISVHNDQVIDLVNLLLDNNVSELAGLGARDALRLEAGLCLYGHDLNENISPVEADLLWTMSKKRRENGVFLGSDIIRNQIQNGVTQKRVGLKATKKVSSPREGMNVYNSNNENIGYITSGGPSPCLDMLPIAMGYVNVNETNIGNKVLVEVRKNKNVEMEITSFPFVEKGYFKN